MATRYTLGMDRRLALPLEDGGGEGGASRRHREGGVGGEGGGGGTHLRESEILTSYFALTFAAEKATSHYITLYGCILGGGGGGEG